MKRHLRTITTLFRWCREAVLTIGALAGLTCIILAIGAVAFDSKALVFQSGSMEPAVSAGALGFTRPADADELEIGDVVSVVHEGTRVTHRIANIEPNGPGALLTLQGASNDEPDLNIYEVSSTDRLVFDVPYLGYVVTWAATPRAWP